MNEQELQEIAKQLSKPTGSFGLEVGERMNDGNISMTRKALEHISLTEVENRVLELGHGNAGHLSLLLNKKNTIQYHGLEISSTMMEEAVRINESWINKNRAAFHLYDGESIPFESDYFQQIYTVNTIYFWQNPQSLLKEMYRVLETKGRFILVFAKKSFMKKLAFTKYGFQMYETKEVVEMVEKVGFKRLNTSNFEEQVESKEGQQVDRSFTVIVFQK